MGKYYRDYGYYTPAPAREVKGGIKAQSKRGGFADKWWGKRWIQTLEAFNLGARLSRGRNYARKGQVAELEIGPGSVTAKVQGSRPRPYAVTIKLKALTTGQWEKVTAGLVEEPLFAARLFGGEMPEDIETVFEKAGVNLFPKHGGDLETDCSCPDWSNPCKHVAAVYYLLAEAFDNDPFLIFRLRGMDRAEFLKGLRGAGAVEMEAPAAEPVPDPEPLPTDPQAFWQGSGEPATSPDPGMAPTIHASLPRRLGNLPFWRSGTPFLEAMDALYRKASESAAERLGRLMSGE